MSPIREKAMAFIRSCPNGVVASQLARHLYGDRYSKRGVDVRKGYNQSMGAFLNRLHKDGLVYRRSVWTQTHYFAVHPREVK